MDKQFKELKRYVKIDGFGNIKGIEIYITYQGKTFLIQYTRHNGQSFSLNVLLQDGTWGYVWSTEILNIVVPYREVGIDVLIDKNLDVIKDYIKTIY